MPLPSPRPPQQKGTGPFDDAELRALYGIHASTPSSELVATLREHPRDVDPNRLFAVVPLPHAATTEIFVRQLQALITPGTQVSDNLVEAWIWWFNTHQQAQGRVGPTPGLGTHAHSAAGGPQTRAQHRRPGAGCPATEARRPLYPAVRRPGGMRKRDRP